MICTPISFSGGSGFVCSGGSREPRPRACGAPSSLLCDGPAPPGKRRKTCSTPICAACATKTGEDTDLCPACSRAALPKQPANAVGRIVLTGRVGLQDPDALDITRWKGGAGGAPFAPSWELLKPVKRVELEVKAMRKAGRVAEAEGLWRSTWAIYRRGFLAEMLVSSASPVPPGWEGDVAAAEERRAEDGDRSALEARGRVVLLCFCAPTGGELFCHRVLVAQILTKRGAVYQGEIARGARRDLKPENVEQRGLFKRRGQ